MCLLLIAYRSHPDFPLIIAANRDEFHARPTASAMWWNDYPEVLGGRDLVAGGSWLGVTTSGSFGAITNFRDPTCFSPARRSRGLLVRDFLVNRLSPVDTLSALTGHDGGYNGFNLVLANPEGLWGFSSCDQRIREIQPGVVGVSNGPFEASWPKVVRGREHIKNAVEGGGKVEIESLFALLLDRHRPEDDALPDSGLDLKQERLLSSAFIVSPNYGTRSSTVVMQRDDGTWRFVERSYDPKGLPVGEEEFTFKAPSIG